MGAPSLISSDDFSALADTVTELAGRLAVLDCVGEQVQRSKVHEGDGLLKANPVDYEVLCLTKSVSLAFGFALVDVQVAGDALVRAFDRVSA